MDASRFFLLIALARSLFCSTTHHPQVLQPSQYASPEQLQRERERLFQRAWHCVGTLAEIPQEGDFITLERLDYPLLVWRKDGEVHAFLNVCAHRFCTLSGAACGRAQPHLKCQYHGWEYDATGSTRRIPDAKNFKPLEPGVLGLRKFRTELLEQLIFVTFSDDAPPLPEYLGPLYDQWRPVFTENWWMASGMDYPVDANWKAIVENALESYHTDCVHAKTFGAMPPERICQHRLEPQSAEFTTSIEPQGGLLNWLNVMAHRLTGLEVYPKFAHVIRYPNLMFGRAGLVSWVEQTFPLSATRSRRYARAFYHGGRPGSITGRLVTWLTRQVQSRLFGRVNAEDDYIVTQIQRGLGAPLHPSGGLISAREERVFHFQRFVQQACGAGSPAAAASQKGRVAACR